MKIKEDKIRTILMQYLYNHNYISFNKIVDRQKELSPERAECIVSKFVDLLKTEDFIEEEK